MPAPICIPFFQEGKPFDPRVLIEDLETYEAAEEAAFKGKVIRMSVLVRARAKFLETVLGRAAGKPVTIEATVSEVQAAFFKVYRGALERDEAAPPFATAT